MWVTKNQLIIVLFCARWPTIDDRTYLRSCFLPLVFFFFRHYVVVGLFEFFIFFLTVSDQISAQKALPRSTFDLAPPPLPHTHTHTHTHLRLFLAATTTQFLRGLPDCGNHNIVFLANFSARGRRRTDRPSGEKRSAILARCCANTCGKEVRCVRCGSFVPVSCRLELGL